MAQRLEIKATLRPFQKQLEEALKRFNVLVCHRRFGKTVFCVYRLVRQALECDNRAPRFAYVAPLYKQAKQVAWDYLQSLAGLIPGTKVNQAELRVDLANGARIQLYGADNPDALRGIYLDGVVLDEYAQMSPRMWSEVIRPTLADRQGWAIFIGTPQGKNAFYDLYQKAKDLPEWYRTRLKASQTGVMQEAELQAARLEMSENEYNQEFECSWSAAIKGAYYARALQQAEQENRTTTVPWETTLPVHTAWDLGVDDATCIWFFQQAGREIRVIDFYEAQGHGLTHYVRTLQQKPYIYGDHLLPHDVKVRELGTGRSRLEVLQSLGIRAKVVPQLGVEDGINAVRAILPRCWFDSEKCARGVEALSQYRSDYDEARGLFRGQPLHDWTSHAADAFRYLAVGIQEITPGGHRPRFAVMEEERQVDVFKEDRDSFHHPRPSFAEM
ncbi:MAG: hypothetical protein HQL50_16385 [Magnetococcales bacterium]|nr:hypothetical protein [Magnetococcales bacterium]